MSKKLSVLVMGATGNQGGAVVRHLLPKGHRVRTLTRNPDSPKAKELSGKGVEVVKGDFTEANGPAASRCCAVPKAILVAPAGRGVFVRRR